MRIEGGGSNVWKASGSRTRVIPIRRFFAFRPEFSRIGQNRDRKRRPSV